MPTQVPIQPENIRINLARLKRHYEVCVQGYDEISLFDLAHTLRMWSDMEKEVKDYFHSFPKHIRPRFTKYALRDNIAKVANLTVTHMVVDFPGRLILPGMIVGPFVEIGDWRANAKLKPDINDEFIYEKTDFMTWMHAEAVRINFVNSAGKLDRKILSRHVVITRVANTLGPSHPVGSPGNNQFNEAIKELLEYSVGGTMPNGPESMEIAGGFPMPYLILMKIAQDIIAAFAVTE
jgi:hypothetical protein